MRVKLTRTACDNIASSQRLTFSQPYPWADSSTKHGNTHYPEKNNQVQGECLKIASIASGRTACHWISVICLACIPAETPELFPIGFHCPLALNHHHLVSGEVEIQTALYHVTRLALLELISADGGCVEVGSLDRPVSIFQNTRVSN